MTETGEIQSGHAIWHCKELLSNIYTNRQFSKKKKLYHGTGIKE